MRREKGKTGIYDIVYIRKSLSGINYTRTLSRGDDDGGIKGGGVSNVKLHLNLFPSSHDFQSSFNIGPRTVINGGNIQMNVFVVVLSNNIEICMTGMDSTDYLGVKYKYL